MNVEEYFGEWYKLIDKGILSNTLKTILPLYNSNKVYPSQKDIFRAFELCPYHNLKIVFLGDSPYPNNKATGLAFGNEECRFLSPSLEVIKEACIDYTVPHNPIDFDITLESWAKQGVLLLNSSLTVEDNKSGNHSAIWRNFISSFLTKLSEYNSGIIYVLFGKEAQTFKPYISSNNDIIEMQHPAWYARNKQRMPHELFTNITDMIDNKYGEHIVWFTEY